MQMTQAIVRSLAKKLGSQRALAKTLGVRAETVSRWVQGRNAPNGAALERMLKLALADDKDSA